MKEKKCIGGVLDKKYASSLSYVAILRNPNSKPTDPSHNLNNSNSPKLIFYIRRQDSCTCTTDQKMPVQVPVPLWDTAAAVRRYRRREKGKRAGDLSIKSCSRALDPILETENPVSRGIHRVKGNSHLEDGKIVKKSKNATESGSQESTSGANNICGGNGISGDFDEKHGKVKAIPALLNVLIPGQREKKLLVLDLNGLLLDLRQENGIRKKSDFRVNGKRAFKRPFCDDFLRFCFENFKIGIWSSRNRENINTIVHKIMGDFKHEILFCWDQSKCTETGHRALENVHKKLLLKDLNKIWEKTEADLPFEKGEYNPSNTLLVDDSPYKALCNPPYTAIFPMPYSYEDAEDISLGPGGQLRCYLEGLVKADDVLCYVRDHPFGQPAISDSHPSWDLFKKILNGFEKKIELSHL